MDHRDWFEPVKIGSRFPASVGFAHDQPANALEMFCRDHGNKIASVIHLIAFSGEDSPLYENVNVQVTWRLLAVFRFEAVKAVELDLWGNGGKVCGQQLQRCPCTDSLVVKMNIQMISSDENSKDVQKYNSILAHANSLPTRPDGPLLGFRLETDARLSAGSPWFDICERAPILRALCERQEIILKCIPAAARHASLP